MAPILITSLKGAFDQKTAEARAIHKEVTLHLAAIFQHHVGNTAILAIKAHIRDLALHPDDPAGFAICAQELGIKTRVKMIGIVECRLDQTRILRWRGKAAALGNLPCHGEIIQRARVLPGLAGPQIILMQRHHIKVRAICSKRMEIAVALAAPIHKFNAQFKRPLRANNKVLLIKPKRAIKDFDGRDGCLADTNGTNLIGFDQGNHTPTPSGISNSGRGHPACRPATNNHQALKLLALTLHYAPRPCLMFRYNHYSRDGQSVLLQACTSFTTLSHLPAFAPTFPLHNRCDFVM